MATFPSSALGVAFRMRHAMDELNEQREHDDLIVRIGTHEGPCLAVISNERLDYFVRPSTSRARLERRRAAGAHGVTQGIADQMTVYEIP